MAIELRRAHEIMEESFPQAPRSLLGCWSQAWFSGYPLVVPTRFSAVAERWFGRLSQNQPTFAKLYVEVPEV